ncbi:MAG: phosphoenolpyruvate--protein phosphotransferase [Acetobacteraceae bacterium]|nr:phosphoenolpyruvate--protein phosphotransferase [Acetobacteraceae bacterium]
MSRTEVVRLSGEAPAEPPPLRRRRRVPEAASPERPERHFKGVAVSPGIAIGPAFAAQQPALSIVRREINDYEREDELHRFDEAVAASKKQLTKLKSRIALLPPDAERELEPLLDAYVQMLGPSRLVRGVRKRVEAGLNAEGAVADETEALAAAMAEAPGDAPSRKRRTEEVREIGARLARNLAKAPFRSFAHVPAGGVLLAETLTPADAALLDPARIAGVAAGEGGSEGHTAIMLRSLGIPTVLGVEEISTLARPGDHAVIDGNAGTVTLNPSPERLAAARQALAAYAREKQRLAKLARLAAVTKDGEPVELQANLELPIELPLVAQAGAQGIGLLRSEFLFMNRDDVPDEDAQYDAYCEIVEAMGGDPVTIRVLDWGGEKQIDSLTAAGFEAEAGANPALGLRGIRVLLRQPEIFETQLGAILRAAARGPVKILLPMVTTPSEVRAAREALERVARRLRRRGASIPDPLPPLGAMIETPGAALAADALALEADFFAIGTNDLAMYALAVDRAHAVVAPLYDPLHPAVLRLIQFATEAALRLRMPVSVCGEIAGDPRFTPLLLGLGLRTLSMGAANIPRVKQAVRALEIDAAARLARRVMEQSDPARITELVEGFGREG